MGADEITFPIMAACKKELKISGSFRYGSWDYKLAVKQVNVKKLITGEVSFKDAEQAFNDVKAGKGIKTLMEGSI
jgi:D-xylulose reductase